jgi:hypothetical protein
MINTTEKTDDRKERKRQMELFHKPTFDAIGVADPMYIPKLFYKPREIDAQEPYVAFFTSEVVKGQDIYTEDSESENTPRDPERRLYKWRFNSRYKEEYQKLETNGSVRYFVPVSELVLVKVNSPDVKVEEANGKQLTLEISETDILDDISLNDASIRDLAAVLWRKPVSNKIWLNELINKNQ